MPKGNRFGVKQRVLNKIGSVNERKVFKGIPKQRKNAENAAKRRRVEISVGEDDVVSKQISEPLSSVSSRKLQESDDESGSDESISAEMPVAVGSVGLYSWKVYESFWRERVQWFSQDCLSDKKVYYMY